MRALAKTLRARASEHSSKFCEQFEQRPNFASTFKLDGTIRYPYIKETYADSPQKSRHLQICPQSWNHLYRNSFVHCIGLEIYEMVYGQTSNHLEKTRLKNPTRDTNSKIQRPSIKHAIWNIPEHSGTSRNIPEHPGTSNNYHNYEKKMCKTRSPSPGASNFHTASVKRRFHK